MHDIRLTLGIKIRKRSYCEISTDSNHMLCNGLGPDKNIVNCQERERS